MPVPFRWRNVRLDGGGYFQRIIPHPSVQNKIVAGCDIAGFYRWSETNKNWSLIGEFPYEERNYWGAASFAWHPTNSETFWFAAGQYVTGGKSLPGGLFKSTDGGATVTQLTFPSIPFGSNQNQRRLAGERLTVCPDNPDILLFGVYSSSTAAGKGLYRSTNGGIGWTHQNYSVLASGQTIPAINDTNGTTFTCWDTGSSRTAGLCFAGIFGLGVVKSTDYGVSWTFIGGAKYLMKGVCINGILHTTSMESDNDLTDQDDPLSGISKYTNSTNTWTNINNPGTLPQGTPLAILAVNPLNIQQIVTGHAYLKHFFSSNNGGTTWTKVNELNLFQTVPYQDAAKVTLTEGIGDFQFDPIVSGRAWFGNFYYVTRTNNFNEASPLWTTYGKGIENTVPFDLLIPKGSGDTLFSGWFDIEGFRHDKGFDKLPSNKFGGSAANDSSIYRNWCCVSLATCPAQPSLWLRVSTDYDATVADVVRSNDSGVTWTKITSVTSPQRIACSISDANTWVVLRKGLPPAYTVNGGTNWTTLSGLPNFLNYVFNYSFPLVADASDGNVFYLMDDNVGNSTTYGNLYKLTKSGSTISSEIISASKLPRTFDGAKTSTLRTIPGEIWGAFFTEGMWKSINGGVAWTKISNVNEAQTLCFGAPDTANGFSVPTLYFYGNLTNNSEYGVWMSQDKGVTWQLTTDADARKRGMHNFMTQMTASQDTFGMVVMGTDGHGAFYGLANPPADTIGAGANIPSSFGSSVNITFV